MIKTVDVNTHMMDSSHKSQSILIFIFWILVPTIDQYTDIRLIQTFFQGPPDDINVTSCMLQKFVVNTLH